MGLLKGYSKEEKSWMMYDWANSAHSVVVVTVLPIFYGTVAGFTRDSASSMATWGYCTSIAMLLVALLAPILGALGDFWGWRKRLFCIFLAVGVLSCAGLAITPLTGFTDTAVAERVGLWILGLYVVSQVGFAGANLYYDSFLVDVTSPERMDQVSLLGYGLGYIGGSTIPLLLFLLLNLVGVEMIYCLSFAFGFTALWWLCFSWPLLKNVRQKSGAPYRPGAVGQALKGLGKTVKEIVRHRQMLVFLLAYFFYIDGVNTIIHMSTSYGDTLGLGSTEMLLALLLVQLLGLPFALLYQKLAGRFGARTMVGVGIGIYMCICVFGFFIRSIWQFWVLAILVATSQGGIQALSRSLFGKMIPDRSRSGEFFGFYDIFGKFSAIIGPSVVALASSVAASVIRSSRGIAADAPAAVLEGVAQEAAPWGVLSILLIFLVGATLYFVVLPRCEKRSAAPSPLPAEAGEPTP
ncbi:MFS transporter [Bittarella sp. HCP28S3_D9]|uniref:MFS transporter n=1 Tax=Bittarella sp. HCP28S3_D9 TaxID=3440253 RepID=UPI003F8C5B0B